MDWKAADLKKDATCISASRRTDIPGLFAAWFERRLDAGCAEYFIKSDKQRFVASLLPEDVTHFVFWTKWPRPFFRVLEKVLKRGYPVLWNVTITGLGGSALEPYAPGTERAVSALKDLAALVPPAAILWRYDPIILSQRYPAAHHIATFTRLCGSLSGHVDRVATSFVELYSHRVKPELARYAAQTGDIVEEPGLPEKLELIAKLKDIASRQGLGLTVCCNREVREQSGLSCSGCNAFAWATRVYPELRAHPALRPKPSRDDCACTQEKDIGVYDTCIYGCPYSYGTGEAGRARRNFVKHRPDGPCLMP